LIDLHLHTTASDGTLTPSELVQQARAASLTIISITDHDTTSGSDDALSAAREAGLQLIPGIEISAVDEGRDVHVLGYFIDPGAAVLRTFLDRQRADRVRRVAAIGDRLAGLGCPIDVAPVLAAAARGRSVGRPQIADALLDAGYVRTRDEAFARFLEYNGAAYVPRFGASPSEVIAIIHDAGGIASLAHPGPTALDHLIGPLAAAGLDAIEAGHSDHDAATEARYRALAAELGLLVTGGSDFHGATGHRTSRLGEVTLPFEDFDRLSSAAGRRRRAH
jgi:predicted metal-dependent phosphoesterase TrpH